jgi:hypothetical protein
MKYFFYNIFNLCFIDKFTLPQTQGSNFWQK